MSALDDPYIKLVSEGLEVHVPSVKARPPRDVAVAYGEHPDTCPVRCWLAWRQAKLAAGAAPGGPAFLSVDQWGHLGTARLAPDSCGRAMTRAAEQAVERHDPCLFLAAEGGCPSHRRTGTWSKATVPP